MKTSQRIYQCLPHWEFINENYKLISIRDEDKYLIMKWRNEQIDILRQREPLTKEMQDAYFECVVDKLFEQEKPNQLLFSFLEDGVLIGYGGLVHIDWESRNAEISFLIETERNTNQSQFISDWKNFLIILKHLSSFYLDFIKIYTYAYDIRPQLYLALSDSNFVEEARLKNHVIIKEKKYDVLIHSCFLNSLSFRMANEDDVLLYFNWANDEDVRNNSFNKNIIEYDSHCKWFFSKLSSIACHFYLFFDEGNNPVGQVRIEENGNETVIAVSVDKQFRGKSLSSKMLIKATNHYLKKWQGSEIVAYIKYENQASYRSFIRAGFSEKEIIYINGIKSFKLINNGQVWQRLESEKQI